ncbi:hypothetical protein [Micromonospora rubida]|uniref:hypothetical protein n=1 Tax=Micromonospora rubida TaxID=2697657 RepID=UPI0013785966|nr:hypothetical protein [Micromonospora rubida]NBE81264.1 hypothetical protein [Micromonospora rubida]
MRLEKPARLLGHWPEAPSRIRHEQAEQITGGLETLLQGQATSTVGVAYATAYNAHLALVSGVAGPVAEPDEALDELFSWWPSLTGIKETPAGPMGGKARCGKGVVKRAAGGFEGVYMDLCGWADPHTIGMVMFQGFPENNKPGDMFSHVRAQLERPAT